MKKVEKEKQLKVLQDLLLAQGEGNLDPTKSAKLDWLLQSFNQKDITEIVKRVSYESYKLKNKGKKTKDLDFSSLSFFSVEELPELYDYFWMRIAMHESTLRIKGDMSTVSLETKGCYIEQKKFNAGSQNTINVSSVMMTVAERCSEKNEIVCYGRSEKQDIMSFSIRSEKNNKTVLGTLRRIHVEKVYLSFTTNRRS
jgi:hypothetical protein